MSKSIAAATGTLAVVAVALLTTLPAQAGASASAPSKYSSTHQVATAHSARTRQARSPDVGITEYSSSSAKNPSQTSGNR
jgi:hypothetical protein